MSIARRCIEKTAIIFNRDAIFRCVFTVVIKVVDQRS